MAQDNPPDYYFNGILYNPSFYSSTSTTGETLTQSDADSRYLIKTFSDSTLSTAIETFNGGINTNSISSATSMGINCNNTLTLNTGTTTMTSNNVNIGTDGGTTTIIGSSTGSITMNAPTGVDFLSGLKTNTINPYSGSSLTIGAPLTISYTGYPSLSTQIGYSISSGAIPTSIAIGSYVSFASITIPTAGVYILNCMLGYGFTTAPVAPFINLTGTNTSNTGSYCIQVSNGGTASITQIVNATASSYTVQLSNTTAIGGVGGYFKATRIA
jgi:hypothetical protein